MQGPGSKPQALHTEYATKDADWGEAYHGDLVFYLVRADNNDVKDKDFDSDIGDVEDGYVWSEAEGAMVPQGTAPPPDTGLVVPANTQAGPNAINSQTATNQIAASQQMGGATNPGPAGPTTGKNRSTPTEVPPTAGRSAAGTGSIQTRSIEVPVGVATQASARHTSLEDAAINVTQAVESASQNEVLRSLPASEMFFYNTLYSSFNPGQTRTVTRSAADIESTFDSPKIADLSYDLARASGGIRSSANLIQGINQGEVGMVTPKMLGQAERLGPQTLNKRYTR